MHTQEMFWCFFHIWTVPMVCNIAKSGYSFITDPDGNIISIESTHNEIRKNFFTSSSDWVFQTSEDGATLQEDFKQGHANCRKIISDLSYARYISYQPLKYNGWMLCYIIPAVDARQPFAFINNFEIILFAFFICIVLRTIPVTNTQLIMASRNARIFFMIDIVRVDIIKVSGRIWELWQITGCHKLSDCRRRGNVPWRILC